MVKNIEEYTKLPEDSYLGSGSAFVKRKL